MTQDSGSTNRRGFLQTSVGLGVAGVAALGRTRSAVAAPVERAKRLPREVWVASLSLHRLEARTHEEMNHKVLKRLEEVEPFQPDVVCLPEVFPFMKTSVRPPLAEVAETPPGSISSQFAEWAKANDCYLICPIYTRQDGKFYNAAVVIDRDGNCLGEYRKIHPTVSEMERGVAPGPLEPPVFQTDFGTIGVQICYDINWHEGWNKLRQAGAEIVFWPSAFCGGNMLNALAWMNKFCVVSSTRFDPTKIVDITGEDLAVSGRARNWVCTPINLEKVFLHGWPYWTRYNDVQAKYGRKVLIRHFWEEGWSILESRSPDLQIADVLREFDIRTHEEHIARADTMQAERRR
ncbi:MAG: nitrilase-related carbon-nitrogen hydrolase [Pirellulaceae bacterium]